MNRDGVPVPSPRSAPRHLNPGHRLGGREPPTPLRGFGGSLSGPLWLFRFGRDRRTIDTVLRRPVCVHRRGTRPLVRTSYPGQGHTAPTVTDVDRDPDETPTPTVAVLPYDRKDVYLDVNHLVFGFICPTNLYQRTKRQLWHPVSRPGGRLLAYRTPDPHRGTVPPWYTYGQESGRGPVFTGYSVGGPLLQGTRSPPTRHGCFRVRDVPSAHDSVRTEGTPVSLSHRTLPV